MGDVASALAADLVAFINTTAGNVLIISDGDDADALATGVNATNATDAVAATATRRRVPAARRGAAANAIAPQSAACAAAATTDTNLTSVVQFVVTACSSSQLAALAMLYSADFAASYARSNATTQVFAGASAALLACVGRNLTVADATGAGSKPPRVLAPPKRRWPETLSPGVIAGAVIGGLLLFAAAASAARRAGACGATLLFDGADEKAEKAANGDAAQVEAARELRAPVRVISGSSTPFLPHDVFVLAAAPDDVAPAGARVRPLAAAPPPPLRVASSRRSVVLSSGAVRAAAAQWPPRAHAASKYHSPVTLAE